VEYGQVNDKGGTDVQKRRRSSSIYDRNDRDSEFQVRRQRSNSSHSERKYAAMTVDQPKSRADSAMSERSAASSTSSVSTRLRLRRGYESSDKKERDSSL
jgi:hypothetical protein